MEVGEGVAEREPATEQAGTGAGRIDTAIRSWVIYHKPFPEIPDVPWMRIAAKNGFRPSDGREYAAVDTGDHIDALSPSWAEFTVLYWVWRNAEPTPWVSFPHYRRHFFHLLDHEVTIERVAHFDPAPATLGVIASRENHLAALARLEHNDCIVPVRIAFPMGVARQFQKVHGEHNWKVFLDHVGRLGEEWRRHRGWFDTATRIHPYQMFVMRWRDFDEYMATAVALMSSMHEELEIPAEGYQQRAPAYLMERFLNLYLHVKRLRLAETPVLLLEPGCK